MKDEFYVVIAEWCVDYEAGHRVVGVYESRSEAIAALKKRVDMDERFLAEEYGYEIFSDNDSLFDAGVYGEYLVNHLCVAVEKVTNE